MRRTFTGRTFANSRVAHSTSTHMRSTNTTNYSNLFLINLLSLPTNNKSAFATLTIEHIGCIHKGAWGPAMQMKVYGSQGCFTIQRQMQEGDTWAVNEKVDIGPDAMEREIRLEHTDLPTFEKSFADRKQHRLPYRDDSDKVKHTIPYTNTNGKSVALILGDTVGWYTVIYSLKGVPKEADTSDLLNDGGVSVTPGP